MSQFNKYCFILEPESSIENVSSINNPEKNGSSLEVR